MTTAVYDIGDLHQSLIAFSNLSNVATDPTTVTFTWTKPDGSSVVYIYGTDAELIKDGVGNYHTDITYDQKGRQVLKWTATGSVELVERVETYVLGDN